ncbi:recombinase zinc beta ribbon domain-containing protein [Candidatus Falkowbacteria bacterium]|nr:recombinase zinc beta ribbon domain-containing protein [Candidatus Falkowbacteria bacterium]
MLRCGTCGMGITGEYRVKKQKNGNTHDYIYYHCTKKNKAIKCDEPCIRQECLDEQTSLLLEKFSLSEDWATQLTALLEKDKNQDAQSSAAFVQEIKNTIESLKMKLQRLLDSYLEQDIEREVYLEKKAKFISEKKSLEEKIVHLKQKRTGWIEPMKEWIKEAENLPKIAREHNLLDKKVMAKKIFGSNLRLTGGQVVWGEIKNGDNSPKNPWAALCAVNQIFTENPKSFFLVAPPGFEPGLPH